MNIKSLFNNAPISKKLILINLASTGTALFLISVALILSEIFTFRNSLVDDTRMKAGILASNSTAAIAFTDSDAAANNLKALSVFPNITHALIYTKDYKVFARFDKEATSGIMPPQLLEKDEYRFSFSSLDLISRIVLDDQTIGFIYIQSDLNKLYDNLVKSIITGLISVAIASLVSFLIISKLQGSISSPILNMVGLMHHVSEEKNYSTRAAIEGHDEVGILAGGFNEMLEQIQKRDLELEQHKAQLEEKVSSRTYQLACANEQLQGELAVRRRAEEELAKARDAAVEASGAKSLFLANMSHEIRTPMNAIIGFAELLERTPVNKDQREYLKIINNSALTLLDIINDILDFTKIERGKLEIEKIPFDAFREFEGMIETLSIKANQKNINLVFYLDPEIPRHLIGDPLRIKQVLINLIGNAIKFTAEGGYVYTVIKVESLDREKGFCNIGFAVEDNGIGIATDKQQSIFDPFTQADYSTTKKFGGTGLGLAISDNIIKMMNGKLSLQSEPGKGSRFSFALRLDILSKTDENMNPGTFNFNIALHNTGAKYPSQESVIIKYLQYLGCQVSLFDKSSELTKSGKIDAVLMTAPPVDAELIGSIKSTTDAPVIAVAREYDVELISGKFDKVIYQPVYLSKLIAFTSELSKAAEPFPADDGTQDAYDRAGFRARVLVAEDVPTNQKLIEVILRSSGIDVELAENGFEAVEKYKKGNFDIIMMDVHMPVCDGNEATRLIRDYEKISLKRSTPIIALTADAMKGTREMLLAFGMDDYITKPIDRSALDKLLEKYLGK